MLAGKVGFLEVRTFLAGDSELSQGHCPTVWLVAKHSL